MPIYYFESGLGCGLRKATNEEDGYDKLLKEVGTYNGISVFRLATEEDISWVRGMGGRVPKEVDTHLKS